MIVRHTTVCLSGKEKERCCKKSSKFLWAQLSPEDGDGDPQGDSQVKV